MFEWNLNSVLTLFWLSLSAITLLIGTWLLIDTKINLSAINFIIQRLYLHGKLTNKGCIPKSYYIHFYILGLVINILLFLSHLSHILLFIPLIFHLYRRLYECLYIHKFTSKMNFLYYFCGLIHYPFVGLTIISDYKYSYTTITFSRYFFALILFISISYIQHNVHLILANMSRSQNENYPIPYGHWIFDYLSCPDKIAEIFIYCAFFIGSHRTSSMAALFVWVLINQSLSALLNHQWYYQHYKEIYPSKRRALLPFII